MCEANSVFVSRGDAEILNNAVKQLVARGVIPKAETFADVCSMSHNQLVKRLNGFTVLSLEDRWVMLRNIVKLDREIGEWAVRTMTNIQNIKIVE